MASSRTFHRIVPPARVNARGLLEFLALIGGPITTDYVVLDFSRMQRIYPAGIAALSLANAVRHRRLAALAKAPVNCGVLLTLKVVPSSASSRQPRQGACRRHTARSRAGATSGRHAAKNPCRLGAAARRRDASVVLSLRNYLTLARLQSSYPTVDHETLKGITAKAVPSRGHFPVGKLAKTYSLASLPTCSGNEFPLLEPIQELAAPRRRGAAGTT